MARTRIFRGCSIAGLVVISVFALGQDLESTVKVGNGQAFTGGVFNGIDYQSGQCITNLQREQIKARIQHNRIELGLNNDAGANKESGSITLLDWPMKWASGHSGYGYYTLANQVDQNLGFPNQLLDYNCGTRTYDLSTGYNHQGTDIVLWPFRWKKMDDNAVEVIAAAAGTIVLKDNGNADKNCAFSTLPWNAIYIEHPDGSVAWYGHFKKNSLTSKGVGSSVAKGEFLGYIGSSGSSTAPHLHFEIYDSGGNLVDPYQGTCNFMNGVTWWNNQTSYIDNGINRIYTHYKPPELFSCTNAITHEANFFLEQDTVYLLLYFRHLLTGDSVEITITQPDNTIWNNWTWTSTWQFYLSAYVYWWFLPGNGAQTGVWKYEATYDGQSYAHNFTVGSPTAIDESYQAYADIIIYPNPSTGHFIIRSATGFTENQPIKVYNSIGQMVFETFIPNNNIQYYSINLTALNKGIYFLTIESKGKSVRKKISII
ncbi:MAG: peptidoglycan DD-metalloendopeptidase family protein [Bacteroidetes bacterium]|nr:peptidoglycan DD-metalloendopeptidase family protein [Bacteroidota bacterium]